MLLIRNRDEMKRHLQNRVEMLRWQKIRSWEIDTVEAMVKGIHESIECIEAWEKFERDTTDEQVIQLYVEAVSKAREILLRAWTDIGQWIQIAERQRQETPNCDFVPMCPTTAGIEASKNLRRDIEQTMHTMPRPTTKEETLEELKEAGAELLKTEDRHGETKSGWWLDGVWLAPADMPKTALRAIRGE